MKQIARVGIFLLTMVLFSFGAPVRAATAPDGPVASQLVRNFYTQLLDTMVNDLKQGEKLGFEGRFKKLGRRRARSIFHLMARFAVGPSWSRPSRTSNNASSTLFPEFSVANYASRFVKFDGEKFDVLGEKPANNGGFIVETVLTPTNGDSVALNYLVRADGAGQLRIVDVYLDNCISELAVRESEFSAIVRRDGFGALIATLGEKSRKMGST